MAYVSNIKCNAPGCPAGKHQVCYNGGGPPSGTAEYMCPETSQAVRIEAGTARWHEERECPAQVPQLQMLQKPAPNPH